MRHPYRRDFRLPFPSFAVVLRNDDIGAKTSELLALLDTGADATLVPVSLLREIRAAEIVEASVRSHWGDVRAVRRYMVDIEIEQRILPGVIVAGDEFGNDVILGRDVLNKLRILLDGPNKETQIR